MERKKIRVVVIGAGSRGAGYAQHMRTHGGFQVVAVAEPIRSRRQAVQQMWDLPEESCYESWQALLSHGKLADVAIIATMDRDHHEPAIKAMELGYDLLLEKPICPTPEETMALTRTAQRYGRKAVVCTVLRYTDTFIALKEIIDSGRIGKVLSVNHEEAVGNIHQTHSFVRGNWGNSGRSSTMLLQKSCHDIDILQWLIGKKCKKVQSFGMLTYFTEENAPEGATERCIDGCPHADTCPYSAVKLYLDDKENRWFRDACTKEADPTDEQVEHALRTTQYGKCVYLCDNDVVDHQTVNMVFEDEVLVTFTMNAFNRGGRSIHIMGTKGEVTAALDDETPIRIYPIHCPPGMKALPEVVDLTADNAITSGHGGGDAGIIRDLYSYLSGTYTGKSIPSIADSCYTHMITFAAEEARLTGTVVDVEKYIKGFE